MTIIITGNFDVKLDYLLNIKFNKGTYLLLIPTFENGLYKLKPASGVAAGPIIDELLTKIGD